jgi:hypothetical protein
VTAATELATDAVTLAAQLGAQLDGVYAWLVDELGFPFDWATVGKPPWLNVGKLAEVWAAREARFGDTAEDYRDAILEETGWPGDA